MSKVVGDIAISVDAETEGLINGLKSGKVSVQDFGAKIEQMGKRINAAEVKTRSAGGAFRRLGNVSNRTRAQIQNTSFQLQDMAVQLEMGTSATRVLSQQLPQLAGGFGPLGAAIGAVIGIGLPALTYGFSLLGQESVDLKEKSDALTQALQSYKEAADLAASGSEALAETFGVQSEAIGETLKLLRDLALVDALAALEASVGAIGEGFAPVEAALNRIDTLILQGAESGIAMRRVVSDLQSDFGLTVEQARQLAQALDQMKAAKAPEQISSASRQLQAVLGEIYGDVSRWPAQFQQVARDVATVEVNATSLQAKVDTTRTTVVEMANAFVQSAAAIGGNIPNADALLSRVQSLAKAAWDYAGAMGAAAPKGGRGGDPRQFTNLDEYRKQLEQQSKRKPLTGPVGGGGGGAGGGGSADATEAELEALRLKYATEQELLDINLQTTLEKLAAFREAKKISEEEANNLELAAKKEHEDAMAKLERDAQQARLQSVSGALGDLASLMQSGNDKLHKIGKAAAIADAVVSGYGAAVSAWEKGMKVGGPPVAAAFTAASLAKTASLISGIQSSSSSGGSQAAAVSGGDVATPTREVQVASFRFLGDAFSPDAIIDAINQAADDGHIIRAYRA